MSAEDRVRHSIDHLFRHQAGQMVSVLARKFGVANIELIEDSVQDAMIAAMKSWPYSGVPENQTAWLIQTAKNRVIDQLRRAAKSGPIDDDFEISDGSSNDARFEGELTEDQIRMTFACCHPEIPADSRVGELRPSATMTPVHSSRRRLRMPASTAGSCVVSARRPGRHSSW